MSAPRTGTTTVVTMLAAAALLSAGMVGCSRSKDTENQTGVASSDAMNQTGSEAAVGGAAGGTNAGTSPLPAHTPGDGVVGSSDTGMTPPTGGQASPSS